MSFISTSGNWLNTLSLFSKIKIQYCEEDSNEGIQEKRQPDVHG